jgi:hypothetical protein
VRTGFAARSVHSVDLLERPLDIGQTWADATTVNVRLGSFQVVSLRYTR